MNLISGLTDRPKQQTTLVLADGRRAILLLEYRPNQLGWFGSLSVGEFEWNGFQLVASPNLLRQFRLRLNFGLAVIGAGNLDPVNLEDFVSGAVALYLLDASDVADVEAALYTGD